MPIELSPSFAAPIQISHVFLYQSYFNSTLLETAVLPQGIGSAVLDSASTPAMDVNVSGFGVGLEPSSETPVAIAFKQNVGGNTSSAIVLRPGEVIFPYGRTPADAFSGFRWGLPTGWLGGGRAGLVVFRSPRTEIAWFGRPELVFHRQEMYIWPTNTIVNSDNLVAKTVPNWPLRFPSPGTRRGTSIYLDAVPQGGSPILTVEPSKTAMRLNLATVLAQPSTVRFLFMGTKEFETASDGSVTAGDILGFQDVTFPTYAEAGISNNSPAQALLQYYTSGPLVSLGCDPAVGGLSAIGVAAIDLGDGDVIGGKTIQIVRYGRL